MHRNGLLQRGGWVGVPSPHTRRLLGLKVSFLAGLLCFLPQDLELWQDYPTKFCLDFSRLLKLYMNFFPYTFISLYQLFTHFFFLSYIPALSSLEYN